MGINSALLAAVFLTALGCAQGHCRRMAAAPQPAAPISSDPPIMAPVKPVGDEHTLVYKYDGSLQCEKGKAIALDAMAKELKGVTIFSSVKKQDGLMHIQVCGSITGMANVYEIPAKMLKRAESKGFRKWSFE